MPEAKEDYQLPIPPAVKEQMRRFAQDIAAQLPQGWGFTLLVFQFGPSGAMAYISNAERQDVLQSMSEFIKTQGH